MDTPAIAVRSIPRQKRLTVPLAVVFFASGAAALIYQITWQRALFTIFGINIEAVTIVVTGFLLGLGLGSVWGGWLSRIAGMNLLALFGCLELLLATYGGVSLQIFRWAGSQTSIASSLVVATVTIVLVVLPTVLMGATLPVLTQYFIRYSPNVGHSVGLLYSINTLGSATACLISGLWMMRILGMQKSILVAATINLLVGVTAFILAWYTRSRTDFVNASHGNETAMRGVQAGVLKSSIGGIAFVAAVLTGFTALSFELVWFRSFMIATNVAPAFALVLGAYLGGIAVGSWWVRARCDAKGLRSVALHRLLWLALLMSSVVGLLVLPIAARVASGGIGTFVVVMLLLVGAQTAVSGIVFPLLCHFAVAAGSRAGSGVSRIYFGNILGSVAGSLFTGFVLMDYFSTAALTSLLASTGAALSAWIAVQETDSAPAFRGAALAATLAVLIGSVVGNDVLFDRFFERIIYKNEFNGKPAFTHVIENKNGVVTVTNDGTVFGGGMYDGRASVDLIEDRNHLIRPLSLGLFHPGPRKVLMIGLATGAWAQIVVNHPDVEHLTVVEINPGYLSLIGDYPAVQSLLSNPKVTIIIDDGRRWLTRNPGLKFDAIVQNTTWHFRPNATNLLSVEYLELVSRHLRDGGITIVNATYSERVYLTGCTVFDEGFRQMGTIVAGKGHLTLDSRRFRQQLENYTIDGRRLFEQSTASHKARIEEIIAEVAVHGPDGSVTGSMESCRSIRSRLSGLALITDDNMGEEWQPQGRR